MKRVSRLLAGLAVVLTLAAAITFSGAGNAVHAAPAVGHTTSSSCGYYIASSNPINDPFTGVKYGQIRLWVDSCNNQAHAQIVDASTSCVSLAVLIKYGSSVGTDPGGPTICDAPGTSVNSNSISYSYRNTCAQGWADGWFNQSCA